MTTLAERLPDPEKEVRTLTQALADNGITHRKGDDRGRILTDAQGNDLSGVFDAFEGWALVAKLENQTPNER